MQRLKEVAHALCLIACACLIISWAWSYYARLLVCGVFGSENGFSSDDWFTIVSLRGRVAAHAHWGDIPSMPRSGIWIEDANEFPVDNREAPPYETTFGFAIPEFSRNVVFIIVPHWFLVLTAGLAMVVLRLKRPWRHSLRGALLLTSFIAILLALGITLDL